MNRSEALLSIVAQAVKAKNAILEATDELKALDDAFDAYPKIVKIGAKDDESGLLREARRVAQRSDELCLEALNDFLHGVHCLEQALTPGSPRLLHCAGCGATVRITDKLAEQVKSPACVVCHGDLALVETI